MTSILLTICLSTVMQGQGGVQQQLPPGVFLAPPPDTKPVIIVSNEPFTPSQLEYVQMDPREVKAKAEKEGQTFVPLKGGSAIQFGDPMGVKRLEWAQLFLSEYEAHIKRGKKAFAIKDFSKNVQPSFRQWALDNIATSPNAPGIDVDRVEFDIYPEGMAHVDVPGGWTMVHMGGQPFAVASTYQLTAEEEKKGARPYRPRSTALYIERLSQKRAAAAVLIEEYFRWLSTALDMGRARYDEQISNLAEEQFGMSIWKPGQTGPELTERVDKRRLELQVASYMLTKGMSLDELSRYVSESKVISTDVHLSVTVVLRSSKGVSHQINTRLTP